MIFRLKNETNLRVASNRLYRSCDLSKLSFNTTDDLHETIEHLGQARAMDALRFGIGIKHEGYNLYILGSTGIGKYSAVKKILEKESPSRKVPYDWCYINNFNEYHKPLMLVLPPGRGQKLKHDMEHLIEDILVALPATFQGDEYRTQAQKINDALKTREENAFIELAEKAKQKNISMLYAPGEYTLGPIKDGKRLTPTEFGALPKEEQKELTRIVEDIEVQLKQIIHTIPNWHKKTHEELKKLNREVSQTTIDQYVEELKTRYEDLPDAIKFIETVKQDIIDSAEEFLQYGQEQSSDNNSSSQSHDMIMSTFSHYQVNVLVDNSDTKGAPIIYEDNPTYQNLIGHIDHIAQYGTLLTDFSLIKPGALHRANGGYLILDAHKLLSSAFSWGGIKRALRSHEIRIESLEQLMSLASTTSLQPEPIPLDVKIILTGNRMLYYMLKEYDPDFTVLFKVAADFEEDMDRNEESTELYAHLIATLQREDELASIDKEGVARIIEHCARMANDGEKISLHMGNLVDLLREADYWSKESNKTIITKKDVQKAIDTRRQRLNRIQDRAHEEILRGIYLLNTSGEKVAQVNGLSIIQLGDYAFGRPVRITATARLGSGKVIDIEREVELGGSVHSKGIMILSAYLANHYAKELPLALSATLVFEQSYGMIEGDSASAAELCALLSALADVPIKQSLAVTGSINQHGEIQAIGGVNEKIEGFFDICNARGLTGSQGVIIPRSNEAHLMLRQGVRDAVDAGQFTIYSVDSIDEVLSLLTGKETGEIDEDGHYPDDSLNHLIQQQLQKLSKLHKEASHSDTNEDSSDDE